MARRLKWQEIRERVLDRINSRQWKLDETIPKETDLAIEYGCSRATINRALQALADEGFLERRRKSGTRIPLHPVRKATIDIPIIQQEITKRGFEYDYTLISKSSVVPPPTVAGRMQNSSGNAAVHVQAVHLADGSPYVFEDRWISLEAVPEAAHIDFRAQSPNQWLIENAPYSKGDIAFSAMRATQKECEILACETGSALLVIERRTWIKESVITAVTLVYAPRHRMYHDL